MRVEMTFDETRVFACRYTVEGVADSVKNAFLEKGLTCTAEPNPLVITGTGVESDYGNIWALLLALMETDWYLKCAASCVYIDDQGRREDVLSQAWKVRRSRNI